MRFRHLVEGLDSYGFMGVDTEWNCVVDGSTVLYTRLLTYENMNTKLNKYTVLVRIWNTR